VEENPLTPEQRALETLVLQQNAIDYWHVVDLTGGAGVSAMFVEDGIFHAGPGQPLVGRAAIEAFYGWRQDRGARTSRHLITNFRAEFTDATHATTNCVMQVFAADGKPIHPTRPPILVADQIDRCIKGADGTWRYVERDFTVLFMGGEAPTIPPEDIAKKHNRPASAP
jgi:hypothetical protein